MEGGQHFRSTANMYDKRRNEGTDLGSGIKNIER